MLSLHRALSRSSRLLPSVSAAFRRNFAITSMLRAEESRSWGSFHEIKQNNQMERYESHSHHPKQKDLLKATICNCSTQTELETVIDQHLHVMNAGHLLDCVYNYRRLIGDAENLRNVVDDPVFQKLAAKLLLKIRFLEIGSCVALMKLLAEMKVEVSSSLVQGILQMLRKQLNNLPISQMWSLSQSLKTLPGTSPLSETILLSLPLMFETRVATELDPTDEVGVGRAVKFAIENGVNKKAQNIVAALARKFIANWSPNEATSILFSTAFRDPTLGNSLSSDMNKLLQQSLKIIGKNLAQFDDKQIRRIIAAYGIIKTFSSEIDEALWRMAPSFDFDELTRLAALGEAKDSLSIRDLEFMKNALLVHKDEILKSNGFTVMTCLKSMSLLALQSPETDLDLLELGDVFAKHLELDNEIVDKPSRLLTFLLQLTVLDVYPQEKLDLLFSDEYLSSFSDANFLELEQLVHLEMSLTLRFGETHRHRVPPELKDSYRAKLRETILQDDLVNSLQTALGGDQFLLKRVVTPLGVEADLAVVMRQGEYPIALTGKESPLENLPQDCKVVAILQAYRPRCISRRHLLKRVHFGLKERFLRLQNIEPVIVKETDWVILPQNERIPYIMHRIKTALQDGRTYYEKQAEEFS